MRPSTLTSIALSLPVRSRVFSSDQRVSSTPNPDLVTCVMRDVICQFPNHHFISFHEIHFDSLPGPSGPVKLKKPAAAAPKPAGEKKAAPAKKAAAPKAKKPATEKKPKAAPTKKAAAKPKATKAVS